MTDIAVSHALYNSPIPQFVPNRRVSFRDIIRVVARIYNLTPIEITGECRRLRYTQARHIVFYLISKVLGSSTAAIGRMMGKDHTTVIHGLSNIEGRCLESPSFNTRMEALIGRLEVGDTKPHVLESLIDPPEPTDEEKLRFIMEQDVIVIELRAMKIGANDDDERAGVSVL